MVCPNGGTQSDPQDRIQRLVEGYVGREWLLDELQAFLAGEKHRYLLIEGKPGTGKSVFAAHLAHTGRVTAYHFCNSREGGTLDPIAFVGSLSQQLVRQLADFGKYVVEQPPVQEIDVSQEIGKVEGGTVYGVYIDKFILQTPSADAAFQFLVREPLRNWVAGETNGDQVVILVDALDEAARLDRTPNIVGLIEAARDLPPQVRWVLTTRPEGPLPVEPDVRRIALDGSENNLLDLGKYVDAWLSDPAITAALKGTDVNPDFLKEKVLTNADGNFLYLKYVTDDLCRKAQEGQLGEPLDQLPAGLDEVYHEFLRRELVRGEARWDERHQPVLGVLAVAQEALTLGPLAALSDVDPQEVSDVIRGLRQLLDESRANGDKAYRLYHTSFADFLTDRTRNSDYWTDPVHYNKRVASYASRYQGQWLDWRGLDAAWTYAVRHTATHLSNAVALCQEAGQPFEQHDLTQELVCLVLSAEYWRAYLEETDAVHALHRIVAEGLRRATEDLTPPGLSLAVEAALGLLDFCRRSVAPDRVFDRAREGDVAGAERNLHLFGAEPEWHQAGLLAISWLACAKKTSEARDLLARVAEWLEQMRETRESPPALDRLYDRVQSVFDGETWEAGALPTDLATDHAKGVIARLGGLKSNLGLPTEQAYAVIEVPPGMSSYAASIRMTDIDSRALVAYTVQYPEDSHNYVRDQIAILATNSYVKYRNRFLWPVLEAVLYHPDPDWAQEMVLTVLTAALAPSRLEFGETLPIVVLACQAAKHDKLRERLDALCREVVAAAEPLRGDHSGGDSWGSYTRRLAGLAQGYHMLDATAGVADLLSLGAALHFGYAGFQSLAWLTLAEASRICDQPAKSIESVLDAAGRSAHNIQDPTYCAQTTGRYNALRDDWWGDPPGGFDVAKAVDALCHDPGLPRFAARHHVGEEYAGRNESDNLPLPNWARDAKTLSELSELYGAPLADLRRLNPGLDDHEDLELSGVEVVRIPDPELVPLLAARLAAEALVDPNLPGQRARVRLIRRLVPLAAADPTCLDTVLARYVIAAHPLAPDALERLVDVVKKAQPRDPEAWQWLGDGPSHVSGQGGGAAGGEITGATAGRMLGVQAEPLGGGQVEVTLEAHGVSGAIVGVSLDDLLKGPTCPSCHKEVKAEWNVCAYCGFALRPEPTCPKCQKTVEAGWNACPYCGTVLT
jgi:hypothetical protein